MPVYRTSARCSSRCSRRGARSRRSAASCPQSRGTARGCPATPLVAFRSVISSVTPVIRTGRPDSSRTVRPALSSRARPVPGGARGTRTGTHPHRERAARLRARATNPRGAPGREIRQAYRRIIARANQQAKPGRPVPAVSSDLPLPHPGVDTFLGNVETMVRPLEVALEPERVRERLFQSVAQQADDEGHAREHRKVQHVGHAVHHQRSTRREEGQRADEHGQSGRSETGARPPTTAAASTASVNGSRIACSCSHGSSAHLVSATRRVAATATA